MSDSLSSGADADANTTPCQHCGNEYEARGVAAHERHCDEKPPNQSGETEAQSGQTESESGATETPLGAQAIERDGRCRRCGATGERVDTDTDILDIDWDGDLDVEQLVPGDTVESLADIVTICKDATDSVVALCPNCHYGVHNGI